MISKEELRTYATRQHMNLAQTEKNYLHILTLHAISRLFPQAFVFKGGTALMICHGLDRFSEDLDFTVVKKEKITELLIKLQRFLNERDIIVETKTINSTKISQSFLLRYQGPLYTGTRQTTAKVELDISFREPVIATPETTRILHPYPDTPSFYVQTMTLEEVFAEKIRALLTRQKARDLFDIEFLLARKVKPSLDLINKKLQYYDGMYTQEKLHKAIEDKRKLWKPELTNLVPVLSEFDKVKRKVLRAFQIKCS